MIGKNQIYLERNTLHRVWATEGKRLRNMAWLVFLLLVFFVLFCFVLIYFIFGCVGILPDRGSNLCSLHWQADS